MLKNTVLDEMQNGLGTFVEFLRDAGNDVNRRICGYTMLSFAAECGNLGIVKFLTQKGADIHVKNSNGSVALHIAANYGYKRIVEHFLNSGLCVDVRDNDNCTPLHYLVGKYHNQLQPVKSPRLFGTVFDNFKREIFPTSNDGDLEAARFLFSRGADLEATNNDGYTPLLLAARHSFKDICKFLIKSGAKVDVSDKSCSTVLHYASYSGWIKIVRALVEKGCEIDAKNAFGNTPLFLAVQHLHNNVIEFFLELGADFEYCDGNGWSLLHKASFYGWLTIAQIVINKKCDLDAKTSKGFTPLYLAVSNSHEDVATLLIGSGANDYCDANKWMVLHHASHRGWLGIVESLVKRGSDVDAETSDGETPLLLAAKRSRFDVVKFLMESGANVEACDKEKWTLLHHASNGGDLRTVRFLLNRGHDLNVKTSLGSTALLLAANNFHRGIVDLLVKYRANVECCDSKKWALIHYASHNKWVDLVKSLVEKGCDVNAKTARGDTPLYIACLVKHIGIIKILLEAGAHFNVENCNGDTAFNSVIVSGAGVDTIKLFISHGAYFDSKVYDKAERRYKENILKDIKVCAQAVINKFDNKDLPLIYKLCGSVENLPSIENLKIVNNKSKVRDIQQSVEHDIKIKGFCNVSEACPIILSVLCVKSILKVIKIPDF